MHWKQFIFFFAQIDRYLNDTSGCWCCLHVEKKIPTTISAKLYWYRDSLRKRENGRKEWHRKKHTHTQWMTSRWKDRTHTHTHTHTTRVLTYMVYERVRVFTTIYKLEFVERTQRLCRHVCRRNYEIASDIVYDLWCCLGNDDNIIWETDEYVMRKMNCHRIENGFNHITLWLAQCAKCRTWRTSTVCWSERVGAVHIN